MTKREIRICQADNRNRLTEADRGRLSAKIRKNLFQSREYQSCCNLFCYVSFGSEIHTQEIIRSSIAAGKKVYIPRVEQHGMEFYQILDLKGLVPSKFGVPEPQGEPEYRYLMKNDLAAEERNLMLLPGLAFDYNGNRIGYGAGYYDKYLAKHDPARFYKAALAYDFQLLDKIFADEYDIKADMIITPTEMIRIGGIS